MDDTFDRWLEACAAYQRAVALAHLDTPLGEARELSLSEALERAIDVWPASELADLGSLIEATPAEQQDPLRRVRAWGVSMYLQGAMLPHRREMLARQRGLTCRVDDEVIPVMSHFAHLASESRRDRRVAIEAAATAQLATLDDAFQAQFEAVRDAAQQLGYNSLDHLWGEISGVDLDAQQEVVTELLEETEVAYVELLNWATQRRLHIPLAQLQRQDMLMLFAFPDYQKYYQPSFLVPSLQACLQNMGIDPQADGRLTWRERDASFGPPVALAVQLPEEVVLSYSAVNGLQASQLCASACGQAVLWAYTSTALPRANRLLFDPAVSMGSAQMLADVVTNPFWLRYYGRFNVDADYLSWQRLDRLYRLRRQLGRFLYSRHVCTSESSADAAEAYRDIMMEACHVDYAAAYYVMDWDWQYTSLAFWRGWSLAYTLLDTLHDHFASDWFRNPESGEWLLQYWSQALTHRVDTVLSGLLGRDWEATLLAEALCEERMG
jgi:hypothetical protein